MSYTVPKPEVTLGVAPAGTDPAEVAFSAPAILAADGTFSGSVTAGDGDAVFAKACFGTSCNVSSTG